MTLKTKKVVIIGAGRVGAHCAQALAIRGVCDEIALIDIDQPNALAQAADLSDASGCLPHHVEIYAGGYGDCTTADVVVVAAGPSPRVGQTRMTTVEASLTAMQQVIPQLKASGFDGILVSLSNPCDVVVRYLYEHLDLPAGQILSTGTALDSARLRRVLSQTLHVDQKSIHAYVMGEHGESMMIPWSNVQIGGKSLFELMRQNSCTHGRMDLAALAEQTRRAGWTILEGKGCNEFGIGAVLAELLSSIFHDERQIFPVSTWLDGKYGQKDVFAGVPGILGKNGVEQILELDLTPEEQLEFAASCEALRGFYHRATQNA